MVMGQPALKYETQSSNNGCNNDTFSDFVTLVCQEAQSSQNHVRSLLLFEKYFLYIENNTYIM